MSGRRRYYRYEVTNANGDLRVTHDVIVRPNGSTEFVVFSDEPAVVGERLTLERVVDGDKTTAIEVAVVDCRPAIVNGTMRHRVRLRPAGPMSGARARSSMRPH